MRDKIADIAKMSHEELREADLRDKIPEIGKMSPEELREADLSGKNSRNWKNFL